MLTGKTALITGAMGGIGGAIAEALGKQGCRLMMNDIGDAAAHQRRADDLARRFGVDISYCNADISDRAQIDRLVDETRARIGPVDILVNNAVKRHFHSITDFPLDEWDQSMAVNVTAPFALTRLVLGGMQERGFGRIINISSMLGLGGRAGRVDYITGKTALLGLTRATAAETLTDRNVTCNAICPGSVLTPIIEKRIQGLADERQISWQEMSVRYRANLNQIGDFITPDQIASAIVYLCSDAAAAITGASLPVDAGVSAAFVQGPAM
ncbi:MAG: SDR family oxidoreductase [Alphaproteobacteria bacterium]|nr:SDR family oxidoreductase [Alphaproteobacteria bacterium]